MDGGEWGCSGLSRPPDEVDVEDRGVSGLKKESLVGSLGEADLGGVCDDESSTPAMSVLDSDVFSLRPSGCDLLLREKPVILSRCIGGRGETAFVGAWLCNNASKLKSADNEHAIIAL